MSLVSNNQEHSYNLSHKYITFCILAQMYFPNCLIEDIYATNKTLAVFIYDSTDQRSSTKSCQS